jgi:hypothetical protein
MPHFLLNNGIGKDMLTYGVILQMLGKLDFSAEGEN